MSSVKYVQPNSLIANINEKIDELNRKIIPTCTLKHSDQKQNVLQLVGKFKSAVTNILSQLNQNEVDYNTINFNELNDSLEKAYKLLLDEIILPYEKIDITDITNRLSKLEDDLESNIDNKRGELDELANHVSFIEDDSIDNIRSDIDLLKDEVKKNVTVPSDLNEKWTGLLFEVENHNNMLVEHEERFDNVWNVLDPLNVDDVPKLKTDVDEIKTDIGEIKENADYLENNVIESLKGDISEHYDEFIQLKSGVQQLQQKVQALQASPSGGGTTQALPYPVSLVYNITSEEWTQLIFSYFLPCTTQVI